MIIRRNEIHKLDLSGKIVGVTSGCFDLLHFYHLRYLEKCKAQCDFLIVGVDSDTLVHANKDKWPMIPEHHRTAMVDALKCVDAVFQMDEIKDIENFYPIANKVFKNSDTIYGRKVEIANSISAELVIIPDIEEVYSTSELINKIQKTRKNEEKKNEENMCTISCRGKSVKIEKGTVIAGDCIFGDRLWTVAKVEEEFDSHTQSTEVVIHCDDGHIFRTENRAQDFGFLNRELFISAPNGKTWRW